MGARASDLLPPSRRARLSLSLTILLAAGHKGGRTQGHAAAPTPTPARHNGRRVDEQAAGRGGQAGIAAGVAVPSGRAAAAGHEFLGAGRGAKVGGHV